MFNLTNYKHFIEIIFYIITQFAIMCSIYILYGAMQPIHYSDLMHFYNPHHFARLCALLCAGLIGLISHHWGQDVFRNINLHIHPILFCFLCFIVARITGFAAIYQSNHPYFGNILYIFIVPLLVLFQTQKKGNTNAPFNVPLLAFLIILLCLLYCYFYDLQTLPQLLSICFISLYVLWRAIYI